MTGFLDLEFMLKIETLKVGTSPTSLTCKSDPLPPPPPPPEVSLDRNVQLGETKKAKSLGVCSIREQFHVLFSEVHNDIYNSFLNYNVIIQYCSNFQINACFVNLDMSNLNTLNQRHR